MTLTTEWQKVLEASTKVTSNVTGYLRLYLKYGGRDVARNTDIIYYEIRQYAYNPYGNYLAWEWTGDGSWNIVVGSETKASGYYTQTPAVYSDGRERVKVSGSWEQQHNDDGSWSSQISVNGYVYTTRLNSSGTIDLPPIPRKTTIKATDANIGSVSTIYLTKSGNNNVFNHYLLWRYQYEDVWSIIAPNVKENYPWTVPDEIYEAIPNAKEIELIIRCETYNTDGSLVGEDETTMWAKVNEGVCRPTVSATIKNDGTSGITYQLTGSEKAFIKDYTNATIQASAQAKKSATIQEYKVVNGSKSSTAQNTTINAISSKTFNFYVKDSRQLPPATGYPTDKNVDTFIEYFLPKINTPIIERTEQTSTEVIATINGTYWNGNFGVVTNVGTLKYSWRSKLANSDTWGTWSNWTTPSISDSSFSIIELSLGTTYATNSSYDFQFRFMDALSNLDTTKIVYTASQNVTVSTPVIEVYEDAVNINGALTVFDRAISGGSSSYSDLTNKPALNTNNTAAQSVSSSESINGTINLHKISKTGSYSDILSKPVLNTNVSSAQGVNGAESINGTINLHKVSKTGNYNDLLNRPTIPSNTNQLTNGSGYINTSANSKAQNGYFKLSNGLIVQWGTCSTGSAVTMPTSFSSTTSFAIVGTDSAQGASATINIVVSAANKFTAYAKYGSTYYTDTIRWIAIGY